MKVWISLLSACIFGLASCEDPITEGITLSEVEFSFSVHPDTTYLSIGDTFLLSASHSNTIDGIKLTDGFGLINVSFGQSQKIPKNSSDDFEFARKGNDFEIVIKDGDIDWKSGSISNVINAFKTNSVGDSFKMSYQFIFLTPGTYDLAISPSFYEGSKGKGRWSGHFNVQDPHWDLVQIPGVENPTTSDYYYYNHYLIAVTE